MKLEITFVALAALTGVLAATTSRPQDSKWHPFQFKGNERYDYKLTTLEGEERKETGFALDIKKAANDYEVTWSVRSKLKADELNEQAMLVGWTTAVPAWTIMNPMYAMFVNDLELKEGEKMSVFGAGTVKVVAKETVGGRSGFKCQFSAKEGDKETLTWEWTVDPELALPIKSIMYSDGKESSRAELTAYKKD
jgi:hypothetical protein